MGGWECGGVIRKPDLPLAFKGNGISRIDLRRNSARLPSISECFFVFVFFGASW